MADDASSVTEAGTGRSPVVCRRALYFTTPSKVFSWLLRPTPIASRSVRPYSKLRRRAAWSSLKSSYAPLFSVPKRC